MAYIFHCDICGREIPVNSSYNRITLLKDIRVKNSPNMVDIADTRSMDDVYISKDICNKCLGLIEKTMYDIADRASTRSA